MPGISGAALLNDRNQVIGVAEGTDGGHNPHDHAFATQLLAHNIHKVFDAQRKGENIGENTLQSVTFAHGSIAAFMPVAGPGVQDILHLQPTFAPPENRVHVHVFGYPKEMCIAYHGQVHTSDTGPMQATEQLMHHLTGL